MSVFAIVGIVVSSILLLLILIRFKIQLCYNEQDKYVKITYLFFNYKYDMTQILDKMVTEERETTSKKEASHPSTKEKHTPLKTKRAHRTSPVKLKPTKIKPMSVKNENQKVKQSQSKLLRDEQATKTPKQSILAQIKIGLRLVKIAKRIILRFISRLRIEKVLLDINFNVDDPLTNAMIYANLWPLIGNTLAVIQQSVKEIKKCHYDIKTQFTGNDIFVKFECILTVRMVDIIIVLILSVRDFFQTYQLIRKK